MSHTSKEQYLDRIAASPAERAASAMTAILNLRPADPNSNQFTRDDFDQLRQWTRSQAPEAMDEITGKALGEAAQGRMEFDAAAELAANYSNESGSDEVLATFLTSVAASRNKERARTLTEGISDESRRAEVLKFLK